MNSSKPIFIDISIGDQLTSISCGHVVVELIKFLAYQRQQIPYVYPWLKQIVSNRKENYDEDVKESFQSERHFRVTTTALENLDFILKVCLTYLETYFTYLFLYWSEYLPYLYIIIIFFILSELL